MSALQEIAVGDEWPKGKVMTKAQAAAEAARVAAEAAETATAKVDEAVQVMPNDFETLLDLRKQLASKSVKEARLFQQMNRDGSAFISQQEFQRGFADFDIFIDRWTAKRLFHMVDKDDSNSVSPKELHHLLYGKALLYDRNGMRMRSIDTRTD